MHARSPRTCTRATSAQSWTTNPSPPAETPASPRPASRTGSAGPPPRSSPVPPRDRRTRLRRRLRAGARRERLHAIGALPRQHARRRSTAGPAQRRHDRPVNHPRTLPCPVRRRRPRAAGGTDGGHAAARHAGGAPRASGEHPLWKELPSWFLIGAEDRNIPAALQHYMAKRAGARRTIEIPGASHAVAVSQPGATADLILEAAALPVAA
jgi:pimeloyl-ACP methyl ester carboxylesterase